MKRILITGVAGFIGSSLKDFFDDNLRHYEAYGIDISLRKSTGRCFKGDINDEKFLRNIIKKIKPHYIFHLAGLTNKDDFCKLISVNVIVTRRLLETVLKLKNFKTRIIIPGSAAEYGEIPQKDMPVRESYVLRPLNFYGLSKAYQALLALSYSKNGLDVIVGRVFNISGWAAPRGFSIGEFAYTLSLIEKGLKKPVVETKGLNSKRDYLDIQDACSALAAIAEKGRSGNIYNICSGESCKTKYALDYLISLSALKGIKIKANPAFQPEIKSIVGSNEKIKEHTGWAPEISILESFKNTLDYYRQCEPKR